MKRDAPRLRSEEGRERDQERRDEMPCKQTRGDAVLLTRLRGTAGLRGWKGGGGGKRLPWQHLAGSAGLVAEPREGTCSP